MYCDEGEDDLFIDEEEMDKRRNDSVKNAELHVAKLRKLWRTAEAATENIKRS